MNKIVKILLELVLGVAAVWLVFLIYNSIQEPVLFNKEKAAREEVGIQRLKDLRTLQVAFKNEYNHFTASADSLIAFYNDGKMKVLMQIGSPDDSLAVANTAALRKKNKKITNEELLARANKGEKLVFKIETLVPVKDTLFNTRPDFVVDSLKYIPFSGGQETLIEAVVKKVSGVNVPLFEAKMPYKALLKGLDNQLRVNLDSERENSNKYVGLQVGSITSPNNNAGNWE